MKILFQDDLGKTIREEIITESDFDALAADMLDITEWITNAFRSKARQCVDFIVEQSGRGSSNTPVLQKHKIIADLKAEKSDLLKTGEAKNKEQKI